MAFIAGCESANDDRGDSGEPAIILRTIQMEWGQIVDVVKVGSLDEWLNQHKSAEIIALTAINRGPEGLTSGYYIVYRLPGK